MARLDWVQTFPWWGAKYHLVQPLLLIRHHHNHLDDHDYFHHLDMLEPTVKSVKSALLLDPMIYIIDDWPKQTQVGKIIRLLLKGTLPKAQRTRGLSSYHRISIKHQLQNPNQTSASWLNLKLKSTEYWLRINFVTSTKHQQQKSD